MKEIGRQRQSVVLRGSRLIVGNPSRRSETTSPERRFRNLPPGEPLTVQTAPAHLRELITTGRHADPHTVLGAHPVTLPDGQPGTAYRAFMPDKTGCTLVLRSDNNVERVVMKDLGDGFFEAAIAGPPRQAHHYEVPGKARDTVVRQDAFTHAVTVSDSDKWLFGEGKLRDVASLLGANPHQSNGQDGYRFVVWAPNAQAVAVTGDFDDWDRRHPMRKLGDSGLWEIFVPGVEAGEAYKFRVLDVQGNEVWKSDPAAKHSGLRPQTTSITGGKSDFTWGDNNWMSARAQFDSKNAPVSMYELHLGSWRQRSEPRDLDAVDRGLFEVPSDQLLNYREIADYLVPYLQDQGFTHVELLGLMEHPLDSSWGYQVSGYFAPTARHGSPEDFKYLVDALHQANIGVVVDWVPGHFPKDGAGLARFDGTHLFDHEDDRLGEQRDWNTRVYNYGRPEVQGFLLGSLEHLISEYHLDGARVDGVASMLYRDYSREEWIPNEHGGNENYEAIEFLQRANQLTQARHPGVMMIAEESTSFPGVTGAVENEGLGFDTKWNMGWMHDTLQFFATEPMHRHHDLDQLTNTFTWAHSENFVCSLSHDEVVHGKGSLWNKMPGNDQEKSANLRLLYSFMWSFPGHKLLFMGQEHAQKTEWDFRQGISPFGLDDDQQGMMRLVGDLNRIYTAQPALHQDQFEPEAFGCTFRDTEKAVIGMSRGTGDDVVQFVHNLDNQGHETYRIGVDAPGVYEAIFDSSSSKYGGQSDEIAPMKTTEEPCHEKPYSIEVPLAALSSVAVKRR